MTLSDYLASFGASQHALADTVSALQQDMQDALQIDGVALGEVLTQLLTTQAAMQASIQALEAENLAQAELIAGLQNSAGGSIEGLENYLSVDEDDNTILVSGANFQVVSGEGSTMAPVNGLGNIIIGYNEGDFDKSGSHNLVAGLFNSYSSFGGVVVGSYNSIAGGAFFCLWGNGNTASGQYSSVFGGIKRRFRRIFFRFGGKVNVASDQYSCFRFEKVNTASGEYSSVSGGGNNTASEFTSSTFLGAPTTLPRDLCLPFRGGTLTPLLDNILPFRGGTLTPLKKKVPPFPGGTLTPLKG